MTFLRRGTRRTATAILLLFFAAAVPGHAQKAHIPSPPSAKARAKTPDGKTKDPKAAKNKSKAESKKKKVKKKTPDPKIHIPGPAVITPPPMRKRRARLRKKRVSPTIVIPGPRRKRPDVAEPAVFRVYVKTKKEKPKPKPKPKRIEPFEGVRDFPELQFNAFLDMLEKREKDRVSALKIEAKKKEEADRAFAKYLAKLKAEAREAALVRAEAEAEARSAARVKFAADELNRLNRELTTILPPGKYRFTDDCGLELQPDPANGNFLNLLCIKTKLRPRHTIRDFRSVAANAWLDYPALRVKRELRGVVELREARLKTESELSWAWKGVEFQYADPFLNVLRREYPRRPESILLNEKSVSRVIDRLLRLAVSRESSGEDWRKGLGRVLRPGMKIRFSEACPLTVKQRPRREPGVERVRLRLELSCIAGHSMSRVELLMPGSFGRGELWFQAPGPILARLQYARIFKGGDQFYMVWDTINQIRALEQKKDEKK